MFYKYYKNYILKFLPHWINTEQSFILSHSLGGTLSGRQWVIGKVRQEESDYDNEQFGLRYCSVST